MKLKYLKVKDWILLSLMSLLGLNACESQKSISKEKKNHVPRRIRKEMMVMYGVPTIDYVSDSEKDERNVDIFDQDLKEGEPIPEAKQPRQEIMLMYGVPTIDFQIKGKITDEKGLPVQGVQVIPFNSTFDVSPDNIPETEYLNQHIQSASDTTDKEGNFSVSTFDYPGNKPRIIIRDIDGPKNQSFENQEQEISFEEKELQGQGQGFRLGTIRRELSISLKNKKK